MMGCDDMPNNIKLNNLKGPKFVQNEYAGRLLFHRTIGWHEHFQEWVQSYKLGANNCLLPSRPFLRNWWICEEYSLLKSVIREGKVELDSIHNKIEANLNARKMKD